MNDHTLSCPLPAGPPARILLSHGGGGLLMHQLVDRIFAPAFELDTTHDAAVLPAPGQRLAFTTDAYVVRPLFFPGGDIGTLAINGTVNDLAMVGARPWRLTASFVLEEGLPLETLQRVVASMKAAAAQAGVRIVAGDTKVVERGKGDGVYISTAGIGVVEHDWTIGPAGVQPGDVILLSGDVGRHGIAILAAREELAFEQPLVSDCAALADPVLALLAAGVHVHCLRDLTRGGLATALVEIALTARRHLHLHEAAVPVTDPVRGACELLGFDPLYIANEGCMIAVVPAGEADVALAVLREFSVSQRACLIGEVGAGEPGLVTMTNQVGALRVLDMLSGEQLPRIC
jgi:hydrogenase expression/formation protein HypE